MAPPLTKQVIDSLCNDLASEASSNDAFVVISTEICILVFVSHVLHYGIKRLNQSSIVSYMIAGLLIGRTFLNRIHALSEQIHKIDNDEYLMSMSSLGSTFFMFLVGLEMDFLSLLHSVRAASFVTLGSIIACIVVAIIVGPSMYGVISINGGRLLFVFILIALFSNSASPILIRMMAELKVTMSEVGRIGISAALVNDIASIFIIAIVILCPVPYAGSSSTKHKFLDGVMSMVLILASAWTMRLTVKYINQMSRSKLRRIIQNEGMWILMIMVLEVTMLSEHLGYPSMLAAFIIGLAFPRDGPTTRTLVSNLTFGVNNIILPIYFGYAGVQTDVFMLREKKVLIMVATIVLFGTAAKVVGTLVIAKYVLKMQMIKEGLVLGFLLNVKGHVELIILTLGNTYGIWGKEIYQALLISMLFSNLAVGPAAAYLVRHEMQVLKHQSIRLEWHDLHKELRLLACIHSSHDIPTTLDLIQISSGTDRTSLTPYIVHLVETAEYVTTSMLYNQLQDDNGRNNENADVNAAIDMFNTETGTKIRNLTVTSSLATMHKDVHNQVQEIRAAMIIVPYHRKQRFDGKMGAGNSGIQEFNKNVIRNAPCTVGILVDRGLSKQIGDVPDEQKPYQVAVLFLGGADDREAVAYGIRLAMHPNVSVTLMRFMPKFGNEKKVERRNSSLSRGNSENYEILMELESASDPDEALMADVNTRFMSTGKLAYMEKVIIDATEIMVTLESMKGMYSLVVVGRQQQQGPTAAQLTCGMGKGEECDNELGAIGDLLASSDFMSVGSVLIVQQHDASNKVKNVSAIDDEEEFDEFNI